MQFQRYSTGQRITVDATAALGTGGEGSVYVVQHDGALVAKIYHQPTEAYAHKLHVMLARPPEDPMASQGIAVYEITEPEL